MGDPKYSNIAPLASSMTSFQRRLKPGSNRPWIGKESVKQGTGAFEKVFGMSPNKFQAEFETSLKSASR